MIEVRIQCLTAEYTLLDMGMTLHKGDEVYISQERARSSRDLKTARSARAVKIDYVQRFEMAKMPDPPSRPLPPHAKLSRPGFVQREAPEVPRDPSPHTARAQDSDVIAEIAAKAAREAVEAAMKSLPEQLAGILGSRVSAPLPHIPTGHSEESDPLYIPSNIVNSESPGTDLAQSTSSEDDELAKASAALKATKPRRRRTRKKSPDTSE